MRSRCASTQVSRLFLMHFTHAHHVGGDCSVACGLTPQARRCAAAAAAADDDAANARDADVMLTWFSGTALHVRDRQCGLLHQPCRVSARLHGSCRQGTPDGAAGGRPMVREGGRNQHAAVGAASADAFDRCWRAIHLDR